MNKALTDAKAIFLAALEKESPEKRARYLDEACQESSDLRGRVEQLLRAHEHAGKFLGGAAATVAPDHSEVSTAGAAKSGEYQSILTDDVPLDFLAPSQDPEALGCLGPYEVTGVVGRGGMGLVLKARDAKLNRVVAIKVMARELASNPTARKRFIREAQAAAAVVHQHVVTIHAVDENRLPYLVMEYIDGQSLQEKIDREGHLKLIEILRIGQQVAAGLAAAHAHGLMHRDVKPANILLENGIERVRITDFGLARAVDDVGMTRTGEIAGTPQYMSPEQAQGLPMDARSDLFSLGCVLYAMCTGRSPFRAETAFATARRVCEDMSRPIRDINPEIQDWLAAIIDRLLAKSPAERFQTAAEVADLLSQHLAHLQHPLSAPLPLVDTSAKKKQRAPAKLHVLSRQRLPVALAAAALVCLAVSLGMAEATGVTHLSATVIRIFTPSGTLVVETNDPGVKVTIEGDGGLTIMGAGLEAIRLRPGSYKVHANKDGKRIPLERELVSIAKGGRETVKVKLQTSPATPLAKDSLGANKSAAEPMPLELVRRFVENDVPWINAIQFAPGSERTVVTSYPRGLDVWDAEAGTRTSRIALLGSPWSLGFTEDGTSLVGVTYQGKLLSLDWPSGQVIFEKPAHELAGMAAAMLSRSRVASAGHDAFVRIWDASTGEELQKLLPSNPAAPGKNYCLAVAPDEQCLVAGGSWHVNVWNLADGKFVRNLGLHSFNVSAVAISPENRYVLTGGQTGLLQLFELKTGKLVRRFDKHTNLVGSLAFLPDGRHFVSGAMDGTLRVWSIDGQEVARHESSKNDVSRLVVTSDGRHVLTAGGQLGGVSAALPTDATLQLWELPTSVWPVAAQAKAEE
jgi:serine/threonine protein kinase